MRVKKKVRGKPFKKQPADSNKPTMKDQPTYVSDERTLRKFDKFTLFRYLTQLMDMPEAKLKAMRDNPNESANFRILSGIVVRLIEHPNVSTWSKIMDYIVGPVTHKLEVFPGSEKLDKLSDEELLAEKRRLAQVCMERLRQLEIGGIHYVNPPREVKPLVPNPTEPNAGTSEVSEIGLRVDKAGSS